MLLFGDVEECHVLDLAILFGTLSYMFCCCFVLCEEYFIPSLNYIGNKLSLSADMQGATLMAIGSATPELFTSLIAVFLYADNVDLNPAPSTIIGSSMFNASFVIGFYIISSNTFHHEQQSFQHINVFALHRDIVAYVIAVLALYIFYDVVTPKQMNGLEGMCLICIWILYVIVLIDSAKYRSYCECQALSARSMTDLKCVLAVSDNDDNNKQIRAKQKNFVVTLLLDFHDLFYSQPIHKLFKCLIPISGLPTTTDDENSREHSLSSDSLSDMEMDYLTDFPLPKEAREHSTLFGKFAAVFALSIVWMSVITYILLSTVTTIANCLDISASVVGMTVIAIGSSLPDTLASFVLAKQYGMSKIDMVISNCFSSNTFTICFVLGTTFVLKYLLRSEDQEQDQDDVDTHDAFGLMLIQIITSCVFLLMIHCNGLRLTVVHGVVMIAMYLVFIVLFVIY